MQHILPQVTCQLLERCSCTAAASCDFRGFLIGPVVVVVAVSVADVAIVFGVGIAVS